MDGNFTASHLKRAGEKDNVWLMDGQLFMTQHTKYKEHIGTDVREDDVSHCFQGSALADHTAKADYVSQPPRTSR